jgi:HEAT repeat protein
MPSPDLAATLQSLFDAERSARRAHDELVQADPGTLLPLLEVAAREALAEGGRDEDEASLRLARVAGVLGEMHGPRVVDLLVDILGSSEPEARYAAGEALSGLAFDRFKEVALGVERALERLPEGSPAMSELPYLLVDIAEPGVLKLLGSFLQRSDPDTVAAAIEALVEMGDPSAVPLLEKLRTDGRRVQLEDEGGTHDETSIGELASEAASLLLREASA